MARFVLVHGAFHGAWCWREIVSRLEKLGHQATAIDLPGHGEDRTSLESVTLEMYGDRITRALLDSEPRAILVGHSMAPIGLAAEAIPDAIAALVYIAGLVPPDGGSLAGLIGGFDPRYLAQVEWTEDRSTASLGLAATKEFGYSSTPPEVVEAMYARFTREPMPPYRTPFVTTQANFGKVPRFYIECLRDRVVPLALQREMRSAVPFRGVYSIDDDHCPFFSAPGQVTAILAEIAEKV